MIWRWFISKTVREACALRKHYMRLLAAQRDLLSPAAIASIAVKQEELRATLAGGPDGKIRIKAEELQFAAEENLKPYSNAAWRENVEVLLVALAVAMAIRTFILQPFKIPTGSMQPTLFGVTSVPDFTKIYARPEDQAKVQAEIDEQFKARDAIRIPSGWERVKEWFRGNSYVHLVAESDGTLDIDKSAPMTRFLIFNLKQSFWIGGVEHVLWFPPDFGEQSAIKRAHLDPTHVFHRGEVVLNMKVGTGDHLFVDRLSFNFRKPERGEIVVFETRGIDNPQMPQDQFYIKRLVVLPHEKVQIGNDRHLVIDGKRLDASTPHFENVYGFNPKTPPKESRFSGHVNGSVATTYGLYPSLAPNFPDGDAAYNNDDNAYMVMGDNTCNSFDSRAWGSFPAQNVIGKSFFVYWPLTERFGWGNR